MFIFKHGSSKRRDFAAFGGASARENLIQAAQSRFFISTHTMRFGLVFPCDALDKKSGISFWRSEIGVMRLGFRFPSDLAFGLASGFSCSLFLSGPINAWIRAFGLWQELMEHTKTTNTWTWSKCFSWCERPYNIYTIHLLGCPLAKDGIGNWL